MSEKKTLFSRFKKALTPTYGRGGWWPIVFEPYAGAWQHNDELSRDTILAYHAIFSCITMIASDISKLIPKLVRSDSDGIWKVIPYGEFGVLQRPNTFQNRIQFFENWINSKLIRGNTYVLKARKNGKVSALYILSPDLVQVLVSASGEVFYQLSGDNLTNIDKLITVPASEMIHDRFNCFFHPLVGISPIFASGMAAYQGLKIQANSTVFFKNMSRPGGILSAPGNISDEDAARLKADWTANFSGDNAGKIAVMGDDLKFQSLALTAEESQLVDQLKLTAEIVCSTFHVPKYKVIGDAPSFNNIESLEQQYYSQCLQILIESIELCLDEGLEIPEKTGTEFDLDGLLRMDTKTQVETLGAGTIKGIYASNEARKKLNLSPVDGGDVPMLQEQNWPINMLAARTAADLGKSQAAPATAAAPAEDDDIQASKTILDNFQKELSNAA